ncbi:hypothetical protein [Paenibacillus chitinolyticus]|uniref:hypothetical protein n=1 Tax=Paenibacillus chitinolyticus TaxID=79263 RepID=UPI003D002C17
MKKCYLHFFKSIQFWHNELGAGVSVSGDSNSFHSDIDVRFYNGNFTFDDNENSFSDQLYKYLNERIGYSSRYIEVMDDGRISFNMVEDGDGFIVSEGDNPPDEQLYLCDYTIHIEIHDISVPSVAQLSKLLLQEGA